MQELEKKAIEVMKNAYTPYSNYNVGAALLTKTGKIYTGCNIENGGIMSICAERVAFCKALSEGEKEFIKIFIVAQKENVRDLAIPCGYCRQFMLEFVQKDFKIIISDGLKTHEYGIEELLPNGFKIKTRYLI